MPFHPVTAALMYRGIYTIPDLFTEHQPIDIPEDELEGKWRHHWQNVERQGRGEENVTEQRQVGKINTTERCGRQTNRRKDLKRESEAKVRKTDRGSGGKKSERVFVKGGVGMKRKGRETQEG